MQSSLSRSDKRLMWGALGVAVVFTIVALLVGGSGPRTQSPIPSSYSSDSRGALAAYLLLAEQHFPLQRWNDSPLELPSSPAGTVLIMAEPSEPASEVERTALAAYVSNGGRLLFCGGNIGAYLSGLPSSRFTPPEWIQYATAVPSPFTRGADKIVMEASAYWSRGPVSQVPLYANDQGAPVVTWKSGEGEVLWWAAATPLTNAGLPQAQDLRAFMNVVTAADGSPLKVYWDEYFHGQNGSLWTYIQATPIPWGLLQLGIAAVALIFTFGRRSGPILTPPPASRLSPLEFVETMGALYQNAGVARISLEASQKRLRLELAKRVHLPADAPDAELARAAAVRLRESETELLDALHGSQQVLAAPRPSGKVALESVRRLERITIRLKNPHLPQAATQEKTI